MANYLDGMDGGKHSSEETEAIFTPKKLSCALSGEYKRKHAPEFIQKIDWKLLREQKIDLLQVIDSLEYDAKQATNAGECGLYGDLMRWIESIEGIVSLLDSLQDYAADELEMGDKEVFNLEEKEEKE